MAKSKDLCSTPRCCNHRARRRKRCHKCEQRQYRERNPIVSYFHTFKSHAIERGIAFALTLEQFKEFCASTGYMNLKGRQVDAMSIDRVDSSKGYTADNIQLLPYGVNASKKNADYLSPRYLAYLKSIGQDPDAKRTEAEPQIPNPEWEGY